MSAAVLVKWLDISMYKTVSNKKYNISEIQLTRTDKNEIDWNSWNEDKNKDSEDNSKNIAKNIKTFQLDSRIYHGLHKEMRKTSAEI